jgi:hypothetical protein
MEAMSLEDQRKRPERKISAKALAVAAALGAGAYGYGTYDGVKTGIDKTLEQVNMHWMSPAAANALKHEGGATASEIAQIDANLKQFMLQELKRLRETRP